MPMQTIPLDFIGPSYRAKDVDISIQRTINLYPEATPVGRGKSALVSFPGAKVWSSESVTGETRGLWVMKGVLYQVAGTGLYKVFSNGVRQLMGPIGVGGRCVFADDGDTLVIVSNGVVHKYVESTKSLTVIDDIDIDNPNGVAILDRHFIWDGNNGKFVVSDVGSTNVSSLSYATAEADGDYLVRPYVFNQLLYLFGSRTIETWYDTGTGTPPVERVDGGVLHIGIGAKHSLSSTPSAMYFLGHDRLVYQMTGYNNVKPVCPHIIGQHFADMIYVGDAYGVCFTQSGQNFYVLTFATEGETWAYSETLDEWFELSTGANHGRYLMADMAYAYGYNVVGDYRNGNLYRLDSQTFTDGGEIKVRQRDSRPINSALLGLPAGQRLALNRVRFQVSTGVGLDTGQGGDPVMMVSCSKDSGRVFGPEFHVKLGKPGDYVKAVDWASIHTFYDAVIRVAVSDPVNLSIHGASAIVDSAGY